MSNLLWAILSILSAYVCAISVPVLTYSLGTKSRVLFGWAAAVGCIFCPFLTPHSQVLLRAIAMFLSVEVGLKIIDFVQHCPTKWDQVTLRNYTRFLAPFPILAVTCSNQHPSLHPPRNLLPHILRTLGGASCIAAGLLLTQQLSRTSSIQNSPLLDHVTRVFIFLFVIESISQLLQGIEYLAGFNIPPLNRQAHLSRTVPDFWQRYNTRVHTWLYRNIFLPTGGNRTPIRSMMLTFVFSGILHEAAFAIATSHWTGYQFAFFALQGPAVIASTHLDQLMKPYGTLGSSISRTTTILFLATSSTLFFHGVAEVFPTLLINRTSKHQ